MVSSQHTAVTTANTAATPSIFSEKVSDSLRYTTLVAQSLPDTAA